MKTKQILIIFVLAVLTTVIVGVAPSLSIERGNLFFEGDVLGFPFHLFEVQCPSSKGDVAVPLWCVPHWHYWALIADILFWFVVVFVLWCGAGAVKKLSNKVTLVTLALFLLFGPGFSSADKGMVVWPPEVHLEQSAQNAIIAWDGEEEILIISSNINAQRKTKVLEILPLPSKPTEIREEDSSCFEELAGIMNRKLERDRDRFLEKGGEPASLPSDVEIVLKKEIGVHDITVLRVDKKREFLTWFEKFQTKEGLEGKELPTSLKENIDSYLKRGMNYFVFDVLEPEREVTVEPLLYKFRSSFLYYPLLISGASEIKESKAKVNLFVLLSENAEFPEFPFEYYVDADTLWFSGFRSTVPSWLRNFGFPLDLSRSELEKVSPTLETFFGGGAQVSNVIIEGRLRDMKMDLMLPSARVWERDFWLGHQGGDVEVLQKILINERVWDSDLEATGIFGLATRGALGKFQEKYYVAMHLFQVPGLPPVRSKQGTGYFGKKTRSFLTNLSVGIERGILWNRDLKLGTRGKDVKELQRVLIKEEVWERPYIGPTGYFGPITKRGVRKLQQGYSSEILEPLELSRGTGYVGPLTRSFLNRRYKRDEI